MDATTRLSLRRLLHAHGSFSGVARALGMQPRVFRRQRNFADTPENVRRAIANAARVLFLRAVLRELIRSREVSRVALANAVAAARKRLDEGGRGDKRALSRLADKKGGERRSKAPAKKRQAKRAGADLPEQMRFPGT